MTRKTIVLGLILSSLGGLGVLAWILMGSRADEPAWIRIGVQAAQPAEEPGWIPTEDDWKMPIDPAPGEKPLLEVVAELSKPEIRVGEHLPARFYLRYAGKSPVTVLESLHNSEFSRYPLCRVQILDPDGNPQTWQPPLRCGNTNPLDLREFHDLQPGGQIELHHEMLGYWKPLRPGTYTISYRYDGRGKVLGAWRPFGGPGWNTKSSRHSDAILSRLRTVAQELVESKPRTFEVLP